MDPWDGGWRWSMGDKREWEMGALRIQLVPQENEWAVCPHSTLHTLHSPGDSFHWGLFLNAGSGRSMMSSKQGRSRVEKLSSVQPGFYSKYRELNLLGQGNWGPQKVGFTLLSSEGGGETVEVEGRLEWGLVFSPFRRQRSIQPPVIDFNEGVGSTLRIARGRLPLGGV